jgi:2-polyprenyl-3-methyl-5-hydroxy-6-metoxy-1,4-benzoquinol methylase
MMNESAIRPAAIFDEFLRLCAEDTQTFFAGVERVDTLCPSCNVAGSPSFTKHGFQYVECPQCRALFVSPRPKVEAFSRYYTESSSSKYWASTFYKETAAARREHLWKPKARQLHDLMQRFAMQESTVIDIGGGYGLFAEEMSARTSRPVVVIEPASHLADVCRSRGVAVVEKFLEDVVPSDLPGGQRLFVSFELFEHLHDPAAFLMAVRSLMQPGELFVFTTLSGAGADIRALWQHSKSVSPPHHLNFLTPLSLQRLIGSSGLDVVELTTPGKLDVDIMANGRNDIQDRFWRAFIDHADDAQRAAMQRTLSETGFSSHVMVTCSRPLE